MSSTRRAWGLALALTTGDVVLIGLDLLRHSGHLYDRRFAVTTERGFGEWFQYGKAGVAVLLLVAASRRIRAARVWAAFFAYLLLDDALGLHEAFGALAASLVMLPTVGSLRPQQVGELMLLAAVGLAFVIAGGVAAARGDAASRTLTRRLVPAFALLVFFGVFVDLLHSLLRGRPSAYAVGVLEDGGELLAMSVLVAVVYRVTRRAGTWPARST